MSEDFEIKERIMKKGEEMFLQFGFARVTMDELAQELGMSKKTLYKYYCGKEQLLKEIISTMRCSMGSCIDEISSDPSLDFVQKIKTIMNFVGQNMGKMKGPLMTEIQKNFPEIYNEISEFRKKGMLEHLTKMVNEGIKAGVFRKDVDKRIVLLIYINVISGILNPEILSQLPYTSNQVFEAIIKVLMEGVLTKEGQEQYHSTKTLSVNFNKEEESIN